MWAVRLEDDGNCGQYGVENVYTSVYAVKCVQCLGQIGLFSVEDRKEECIQLKNPHQYLVPKSTLHRLVGARHDKKAIMDDAVSKLN